jgi:Golgi nucleoside diphosphatase
VVFRNARVISGEEEAIYGWAAVNFVKGSLVEYSEGSGTVLQANLTYGVVEMGGASTQIGFFEPFGDVMANLFKLQIGAAKHWNVYVHSFLYFGVNLAYDRLNARLVAASSNGNDTAVYNPCLPGGSEYLYTSRVHVLANGALMPLSSAGNASVIEAEMYSAVLQNPNRHGDFDQCYAWTRNLLRKDANYWCDFAHDRDCSFAGIYQPPLPINNENFGEFIASSNFYDVWEFLKLPSRSSLLLLKDKTRHVCSLSLNELFEHNQKLMNPIDDPDILKAMCFRATFVTALLIDGVGFPETYHVTALDVVNGQKLGWALGSMLYEINALPWEIEKRYLHQLFSLDVMGDQFWEHDSLLLAPVYAILFVGIALVVVMVIRRSSNWSKQRKGIQKNEAVSSSTSFARAQIDYGSRVLSGSNS